MNEGGDPPPSDERHGSGAGGPGGDRPRSRPERAAGAGAANRGTAGGRRHQGRILALQILYEVDVSGHEVDEVLARTFGEQSLPASIREHVERLVHGTLAEREAVDPYIAAAASAFPIAQLPAVDRNVLRLAVFELLNEPAVPPKAAINEAVELAKRFGGENSGRFVNGVLGTVAARVERDRAQTGGAAAEGG